MTEHEELLKLRALVEKQAAELAAKNQVIEAQYSQIEEQNFQIEKQNAKIEKQNARIEKQNIQIENMIQALLHARKKLYGHPQNARSRQMDSFLFLTLLRHWQSSLAMNRKR